MRLVSFVLSCALTFSVTLVKAQKLIPADKGWSNNSVNAVVFRKNSITTKADTQFIAYYAPDKKMVLGKRHIKQDQFITQKTQYAGNTNDAHNSISIAIDGDGYLHVSWDHHGHPLRYAKSIKPYSLELGPKMEMTGLNEGKVTYPQFFNMPNGNLIFMYRDGQSGQGNLAINQYDVKTKQWKQLHSSLIDGERKRNAYWQACIGSDGVIHVSWVWRESPDVASNHDMCYAKSDDGGITWKKSNGELYDLPITAQSAEIACQIPQKSELINQTSMTVDKQGNPVIASYWKEKGSEIPQYHIIYRNHGDWEVNSLDFRKTPFSLSGVGTKQIPISRPHIVAGGKKKPVYYLMFRDEERGEKVSLAKVSSLQKGKMKIMDLTDFSVGSWEPSYDTELWKEKSKLQMFVQKVVQVDGEGMAEVEPQMVYVLEVK